MRAYSNTREGGTINVNTCLRGFIGVEYPTAELKNIENAKRVEMLGFDPPEAVPRHVEVQFGSVIARCRTTGLFKALSISNDAATLAPVPLTG